MYDPDLHTWGADTYSVVQDAEIEAACDYSDWQYEVANGDTRLGYDDWLNPVGVAPWNTPAECDHEGDLPCSHCCPCVECAQIRAASLVCPEWGEDHRYEEQETWDHRTVIGCNCGYSPPRDDDTR